MKLFGVLLTVLILLGAAVGGVVGVLLPKISSGLALGFLSSLFLAVVSASVVLEIDDMHVVLELYNSIFFFVELLLITLSHIPSIRSFTGDMENTQRPSCPTECYLYVSMLQRLQQPNGLKHFVPVYVRPLRLDCPWP